MTRVAVWCNGSTTDFDSVGTGSSPVTVAKGEKMKLPKILRPEIEIEIYSFGGLLQAVKVCVIIGVKRMRVTYKLLNFNYMTHKFIVIPKYKFVKGREKD